MFQLCVGCKHFVQIGSPILHVVTYGRAIPLSLVSFWIMCLVFKMPECQKFFLTFWYSQKLRFISQKKTLSIYLLYSGLSTINSQVSFQSSQRNQRSCTCNPQTEHAMLFSFPPGALYLHLKMFQFSYIEQLTD